MKRTGHYCQGRHGVRHISRTYSSCLMKFCAPWPVTPGSLPRHPSPWPTFHSLSQWIWRFLDPLFRWNRAIFVSLWLAYFTYFGIKTQGWTYIFKCSLTVRRPQFKGTVSLVPSVLTGIPQRQKMVLVCFVRLEFHKMQHTYHSIVSNKGVMGKGGVSWSRQILLWKLVFWSTLLIV